MRVRVSFDLEVSDAHVQHITTYVKKSNRETAFKYFFPKPKGADPTLFAGLGEDPRNMVRVSLDGEIIVAAREPVTTD